MAISKSEVIFLLDIPRLYVEE